jgi:hypothetical protein
MAAFNPRRDGTTLSQSVVIKVPTGVGEGLRRERSAFRGPEPTVANEPLPAFHTLTVALSGIQTLNAEVVLQKGCQT